MDSPSTSRSRREKKDKGGRLAALEKLKSLKGKKYKYEVDQVENVYDEVEEKEYLKKVVDRQNSDWIVDDGGNGYIEDGREIFDDDLDEESIQKATKNNLIGPRKRKREEEKKSKGTIVGMFQKSLAKKKEEQTVEDDQLFANMLAELESDEKEPKKQKLVQSKPISTLKPQKREAENIFLKTKKEKSPEKDEFAIFDLPSQKKSHDKKEEEKSLSQVIEDVPTPPAKPVKVTESQEIDDYSQYMNDFEEDFTLDNTSAGKEVSKADKTATKPSANETVMEDDGFDGLIEAVDESILGLDVSTQGKNRPEMNDVNFDEVIASLDKENVWEEWDQQPEVSSESAMNQKTSEIDLTSFIVKNQSDESVIRFYWWDAVENPYKSPGVVTLFGKLYNESTESYTSCCVSVKNIPRRIYLLPRATMKDESGEERPTTIQDVYKEFNKFAEKHKISEFRSKNVTKSYVFNREGTPLESDYLEVRYPASYPPISPDYSGNAVEHIFGTSVNALELFLMEREIRGPSFLEIKSPIQVQNTLSWCKVQINCLKMENISVYKENSNKLSIPPIIVMTLDVRTTLNPRNNDTEIAMIGVLVNNRYQVDKPAPKNKFQQHQCLVTRPKQTPWPLYARDQLIKIPNTKVTICETETDILEKFLDLIHEVDPDLMVGYDCGFQFDAIYRRLIALKIRNWSRIGKLKVTGMPMILRAPISSIFCGRPVCDLLVSTKELNVKIRDYSLDSICHEVLKTKENTIKEIKPAECPQFYESSEKIKTLVKVTMSEALHILMLMYELNVIPLALQITCIAGNIISRTLSAGRAERNEYLLLHAFSKRGYITPDKIITKKNPAASTKKKAAYAGGLVLEPKRGFYDKLILLMDFNSLYPSIIQEFNLCFTTIVGVCYKDVEDLELPSPDVAVGIVPTEIRKLVESRREVKKLMKTPNLSAELKMQYNIRQLALKLTANSMYGCLGATHCRFYAKGLAALVTAKGRDILMQAKTLVERLNFNVVYGDTDSLMINSESLEYEKAFEIAKTIKKEVNKQYQRLELDIDGVFKCLLLLQKKKYAAVIMNKRPSGEYEYTSEYKGLDIVRRDWCQLACDVGKAILDLLFLECTEEEKILKIQEKLQEVSNNVRENKIPLVKFVITKQLSKNPNDYPDKKQPHVTIAMRLNKAGGRMFKAGDTIPYIVCTDGTDRNPVERTYHIDEFKKCEELSLDHNYYLLSQIFPVLMRICDPIEFLSDMLLAESLGLKEVYKPIAHNVNTEPRVYDKSDKEENPYKDCEPFKFNCLKCQELVEVKSFLVENSRKPALYSCPHCSSPLWKDDKYLYNVIHLAMRNLTTKYYSQDLICKNPKCQKLQRNIVTFGRRSQPKCYQCGRGILKKTITDTECWNQMNFYRSIFDFQRKKVDDLPSGVQSVYDTLKEIVEQYLKRNRYSRIDFGEIFAVVNRKFQQKKTKIN